MLNDCLFPVFGISTILVSFYFMWRCILRCRKNLVTFKSLYRREMVYIYFVGLIIFISMMGMNAFHQKLMLLWRMAIQSILILSFSLPMALSKRWPKNSIWLALFPFCPGIIFYFLETRINENDDLK